MNKSIVWLRKEKAIDISLDNTKDEFYWNPSLAKHNKKLFVSYRGYKRDITSFRKYKSPLVIGILENDVLAEHKILEPRNAPDYVYECGIEDVRIWSDGKDLYGIGVLLSNFEGTKKLNVRLGEIKINYEEGFYDLLEDFGQPNKVPEKNWSPIEGRPHEYMYTVDKLYKDGNISLTTERATVNQQVIHNGTNLVKIKDGYIAVIHQRTRLANRDGCYPNMFIKYNKDLVPIECTDWFVFKDYSKEEVQFMSGAAMIDKDTLAISVGLDRISVRRRALYKALLYKVKLSGIDWQPYRVLPLIYGKYKEGDK